MEWVWTAVITVAVTMAFWAMMVLYPSKPQAILLLKGAGVGIIVGFLGLVVCWFQDRQRKKPSIVITQFKPQDNDILIRNTGESPAHNILAGGFCNIGPHCNRLYTWRTNFEPIEFLNREDTQKLAFINTENGHDIKGAFGMYGALQEERIFKVIYADSDGKRFKSAYKVQIKTGDNEIRSTFRAICIARKFYWWEEKYDEWREKRKLRRIMQSMAEINGLQ